MRSERKPKAAPGPAALREPPPRGAVSLLAAMGLHGAVIAGVFAGSPPRHAARSPSAPSSEDPAWWDLAALDPLADSPHHDEEPAAPARQAAPRHDDSAKLASLSPPPPATRPPNRGEDRRNDESPRASLSPSTESVGPAGSAASTANGAEPAGSAWSFTGRRAEDLKIGHTGSWVAGRTEARAPSPPAGGSRSGGLIEALEKRDVELGLGRGGPVVGSVAAAAHGDAAPMVGTARFAVSVDRSGAVDVYLDSATTEYEGWRGLRDAIAAAVKKKPLRIPDGARGFRVVVEVEAREQYIDGRDVTKVGGPPRVGGTFFGAVEHADGGTELQLPNVFITQSGKICSYYVGASILGPRLSVGCSFENAGTVPLRMVHAREISEARF
jgi:hypothetical protein